MSGKKAIGSLQPIEKAAKKPTAETPEGERGSVQTVRMDRETLRTLKYASIDRGVSQQEIMLSAIRRDLGLA